MESGARSPGEAVRRHLADLNGLLARTVTQSRLIGLAVPPAQRGLTRVRLSFRESGRPSTARLRTRFGPMELFIGQVCEVAQAGDRAYGLRIIEYLYSLTPQGRPEPLLRWEYVRERPDPDARWCRHHLQGPIGLGLRDRRESEAREVRRNDLHLPTGPIPLAEVLRFCIVDLGVRPLTEQWDAELTASAARSSAASGLAGEG